MTTKYNIGTLNDAELVKLGFSVVNDNITIKNCMILAKSDSRSRYIAIPNNPTGTGLDMSGKCYKGINYNPIVNPDSTTGILFDIYGIPDECTTVENCLKGNSQSILNRELAEITALIAANEREKKDINIRLIAINSSSGTTYGDAAAQYNRDVETARLTAELTKLKDKLTILLSYKASLLARNSESSILLSDKNRLLATVNSNIQQKYTKLGDVNNKINTITQDIYTNNLETQRKENIISTLRVIILIIIFMAVILIIYFGMQFTEQNYPDIYNKVGQLNNSIFY